MLKLLVVEDDLASLELMTEILTGQQSEVCGISRSQEAAVLVNKERFDGIFLDLEMPGLNGFDLAQAIRNSPLNKATPIVIVTGRDQPDTMKRSFATGATFFYNKPIDRKKLTALFRVVRGSIYASRRKFVRVKLESEITCTVGLKTLRGRANNLSQGGLRVQGLEVKMGDIAQIAFSLPEGLAPLRAIATVVWAKGTDCGLQFSKMSLEHQEELREFIASMEPATR